MHSKAVIIEYETGVRVIIHTANLLYIDNNNKTQGIWVGPGRALWRAVLCLDRNYWHPGFGGGDSITCVSFAYYLMIWVTRHQHIGSWPWALTSQFS
jgi:hypothetical protein